MADLSSELKRWRQTFERLRKTERQRYPFGDGYIVGMNDTNDDVKKLMLSKNARRRKYADGVTVYEYVEDDGLKSHIRVAMFEGQFVAYDFSPDIYKYIDRDCYECEE